MEEDESLVMVTCPICNELVKGTGENDLSMRLQAHMLDVHDITNLCKFEGRDRPSWGPECKPTVSGDRAGLTYDDRMITEGHENEDDRPAPGEDMMESVRCPVCGETIFGHASEDLSYNLSYHMLQAHDIKRSIMGKA